MSSESTFTIAPPPARNSIIDNIGNTPLLKIQSLSDLTGCEIFVKCENANPGQSIKDRAALQLITDGIKNGHLKKGMTIVEGTAGNTGIGLALVAKSLGYNVLAVMPNNQAIEKVKQLELYGAEVKLVDAVPFANENHFYHTAVRIAKEQPDKYWHCNQFENLSNFNAHYTRTGPEIWQQMQGKIDYFVSVAGTGGTIAGNSTYLKEQDANIKVIMADPPGSGLYNYIKHGEIKANEGSSITEGIGIMRIVSNFKQAKIDDALFLPDQDVVTVAYHLRAQDSILMGSSSALNVAAALKVAAKYGPGKRIITMWCDGGERSASKLYNAEFLQSKNLNPQAESIEALFNRYKEQQ